MHIVIEAEKPVHVRLADNEEGDVVIIELSPNAAPLRVPRAALIEVDDTGLRLRHPLWRCYANVAEGHKRR